jgi:hypothetical protein
MLSGRYRHHHERQWPGSLRQTIMNAQGQTIQFDPALNGQSVHSGELLMIPNITITGPGPGLLTVRKPDEFPRLPHHDGHTVAIAV